MAEYIREVEKIIDAYHKQNPLFSLNAVWAMFLRGRSELLPVSACRHLDKMDAACNVFPSRKAVTSAGR